MQQQQYKNQQDQMNAQSLEIEKQLLFFMTKDIKYVEKIFSNKKIRPSVFRFPETKAIAQAVLDNYNKYREVIIEQSLKERMRERIDVSKNVKETDIAPVITVYNGIINRFHYLKDEIFQEIFDKWVSAYHAYSLIEEFQKAEEKIIDLQGTQAITQMLDDIKKNSISLSEENYYISFGDAVKDYDDIIDDLEKRRESQHSILKTGYPALDKDFRGCEPGSLTLVGGVVGSGKSTALLNLSNRHFLDGKKVLAITLEMPKEQWRRRILSMNTRIPYEELQNGFQGLSKEEIEKKKKIIKEYTESHGDNYKIFYATANSLNWRCLMEEVNKSFMGFDPDVIYVDQLSLIDKTCYRQERETDALGDLTKDMRAYAQLHKTRLIVAVQANRASILKNKEGERTISIGIENIEGSNKVAADADNFIAIRPEGDNAMCFSIVKQREGKTDVTITLTRVPDCQLLYDQSPEYLVPLLCDGKSVDVADEIIKEFQSKNGLFSPSTDCGTGIDDFDDTIFDILNEDGPVEIEKPVEKKEIVVDVQPEEIHVEKEKHLPIDNPSVKKMLCMGPEHYDPEIHLFADEIKDKKL